MVVLLSILSAEAVARALLSSDRLLNRIFTNDDTWFRLSWAQRHDSNIEIYYSFDQFDPVLGWRTKPNLRNLPVFANRTLSTNSRGLRGREEHAYNRDPARTRVLILGDSYTFGDEVGDTETYASYLQTMRPDLEIINMAVHGYGHDQMLLLLQREGVKYRPDVVVLGFVYIDISRNVLGFRDYAKPRFVVEGDGLKLANLPLLPPEQTLKGEFRRSKAMDIIRMTWDRLHPDRGDERARAITRRILDEMVQVIKGAGAKPLFVYLPIESECNATGAGMSDRERFLADYSKASGVPWINARAEFLKRIQQGHVFRELPDGHWASDGHQAVAQCLNTALIAPQKK